MTETSEKLSKKTCRACEGTEQPLAAAKIAGYLRELNGWVSLDDKRLSREYTMRNFMDAVAFIDQIARIAEKQGHHPDLHLTNYKRLRVELSTHAIGGLSENDFILAAKINEISIPSHSKTNENGG